MNTDSNSSAFWDDKYRDSAYIYGERPNAFFKLQLDALTPGILLLPAEGEGRNAVYAARQGWKVEAFDVSIKGRKKALRLAKKHGVSVHYDISSYQEFEVIKGRYDVIALIYAHMHDSMRRQVHRKLTEGLKPGGKLILEAFSKKQLNNSSGGPKDEAMLFNHDELKEDFKTLEFELLEEKEILISEGTHHSGKADVVRIVAHKPF